MEIKQCPSQKELADFAEGALADQLGEQISNHLEVCPDCSAILDSLESADPTLLQQLRNRLPHEVLAGDSELDALVERAFDLRDTSFTTAAESETNFGSGPRVDRDQDASTILGPPETMRSDAWVDTAFSSRSALVEWGSCSRPRIPGSSGWSPSKP